MNVSVGSGCAVAVGSLTVDVSRFGVHCMAGNVSEWTTALDGNGGVVKGGSFADPDPRGASVDFRVPWNIPGGKLPHLGFRLLAEAKK